MTCIATDGRTMAGDGRITSGGGLILCEAWEKVWRLSDGSIVGACGDQNDMMLARDWLDRGADFDLIPKLSEDFEALILRPDGQVEWFERRCVFVPLEVPTAIGSGREVAMTAMDMGLGPAAAVRQSFKRIATCGGAIIELGFA